MHKNILTIAIPTFNRAQKLKRLLHILYDEIVSHQLHENISIIVSDNASTDNTSFVMTEFVKDNLNINYFTQSENLGFDGNLRFLYSKSSSEFVWFLADDDIPLPGSLSTIVNALEMNQMDVLLFGFLQPPDRKDQIFNFPESIHIVNNPSKAIELVLRYGKVSIYVIRKIDFNDVETKVLDEFFGDQFYFITLALSVLENSTYLRLGVISEPLAKCDEEWMIMGGLPMPGMLNEMHTIQHPFVKNHCPELYILFRDEMYYTVIKFAYMIKVGLLTIPDPFENEKFVQKLEWRIFLLMKRPRALFEIIVLKLRIPASILSKSRYVYKTITYSNK